jgi:hypothetical protein
MLDSSHFLEPSTDGKGMVYVYPWLMVFKIKELVLSLDHMFQKSPN